MTSPDDSGPRHHAAMAHQLNAEGGLTLSGKRTWKAGTIGNFLAEKEV
jgi:hypothetical protein